MREYDQAREVQATFVLYSGYPGLVLRHLEDERGGQKKGPNAHPIDGGINQGKAASKGCAYKLQRHLVF